MSYLLTKAMQVTAGLFIPLTVNAISLTEIYESQVSSQHQIQHLDYQALASEQSVHAAKSRFNPRVYLSTDQYWLSQDIYSEGAEFDAEGREDFLSHRINFSVEKPIFDKSLSSEIEAKGILADRDQIARQVVEEQFVQGLIEEYVNASKFHALVSSYDRVIDQLEIEANKIQERYEEKLATIIELEEVRLNLEANRLEKAIAKQNFDAALVKMGVDSPGKNWPGLKDFSKCQKICDGVENVNEPATVALLREEHQFIDESIETIKAGRYPKVKFYSRYSRNDASDSVFGGVTEVENIEVGLSIHWDIYDHNFNGNNLKERTYRLLAKESEINARLQKHSIELSQAIKVLELADRRVASNKVLLTHQKQILDAMKKAYQVDAGDYTSLLKARLHYEGIYRALQNAKYSYLLGSVRLKGLAQGWNRDLILDVSTAFEYD